MTASEGAFDAASTSLTGGKAASWAQAAAANDARADGGSEPGFSRDPLRLSLFLVVLISISRIHQHFPAIGQLRPAFLLFIFCVAWVALSPRSIELRNLRVGPAPKAMAGLAVLACLSAVFGISLGHAATYVIQEFSRTLIFAVLLMVAIRSVRDLATFIWGFIISAGIWVWLAFFVFEPQVDAGSGRENVRLGGLYTYDANDLGLIMMIALPLTLLVLQASRGRLVKAFCFATLFGIVMTTAMTGSRGAMVGLFAVGGALFLTLAHIPLVKRVGLIGVIAVALAVAAPPGYWESMQSLASPTEDYNWSSQDGRKEVALRGLGYMAAYPVFGIGINNFGMAEGTISSKARTHVAGTGIRWTAAHNSYIQVAAELGPLGLGLFLWLLHAGIVGVRRMWHWIPRSWEHGDAEQRYLFFACRFLPVAFVGFAVPAFFVSFAYLTPLYFLAAFMTGFFVLVNRKLQEENGRAVMPVAPAGEWRSGPSAPRAPAAGRRPRGAAFGAPGRRGNRGGGWRTGGRGPGMPPSPSLPSAPVARGTAEGAGAVDRENRDGAGETRSSAATAVDAPLADTDASTGVRADEWAREGEEP
jgi:hypothetical protein